MDAPGLVKRSIVSLWAHDGKEFRYKDNVRSEWTHSNVFGWDWMGNEAVAWGRIEQDSDKASIILRKKIPGSIIREIILDVLSKYPDKDFVIYDRGRPAQDLRSFFKEAKLTAIEFLLS